MGKLKLWPQISRPLIIRGRQFGVGSTRGLGPYLMKPNPHPGPSNLGGKKLFYEKFYFGRKLQGENGGKYSGNTAGRSYTVPIAFGRGGIAIVWLRFATGSHGNWGSHGPPKFGSNFAHFSNAPEKYRGWSGKLFPLREYLARRSVAGDPHPPIPISPLKIFEGG